MLCKTEDSDFRYHFSYTNFENNNSLLKAVGLERTDYGQIVRTEKNQEIRDFFEV